MTLFDSASLQQALQHERALRRLAAALLRDPADADDAVQHALVQEARGRRQPGAPLWPFLCATFRRHAASLRRLAARRGRRERAVARAEAVPGAEELLRRDQLRRRVADAVLTLDEPYRTTVWLRWFEELPAACVAERMRVPVATVRTRLQRAHALLRRRLDRDYGDRSWMRFALPCTGVVAAPVLSVLAVVLAMKKSLFVAAAVLLAALGWVLLPMPGRAVRLPEAAMPQETGARAAPERTASSEAQRQDVSPAATATPMAAAPALRVLNADGTPAVDLAVWLWTEASRPDWTRRVDRAVSEDWPPGSCWAGTEPPPATQLRTDAAGRVVLTEGLPREAVTVQCAADVWFSAALPEAGAPLVLPVLAEIDIALLGAAPDGRAEGCCEFATPDCVLGNTRLNVATASGPGAVRLDNHVFEVSQGQSVRVRTIRQQLFSLSFSGHGFLLAGADDGPGTPMRTLQLMAPGAVVLRCERPLPTVEVTVVEPDGSPTAVAGRVWLHYDRFPSLEHLEHGVATFDQRPVAAGRYAVDVLLDDGCCVHGGLEGVDGQLAYRLQLHRQDGTPPLRIRLPGLQPGEVAQLLLERADAGGGNGSPFLLGSGSEELLFFSRGDLVPVFQVAPGELLLSRLPPRWLQGYAITRDGRIGRFAHGEPGQAIAGTWFEASAPQSIDVGAHYGQLGDLPWMAAAVEVRLADTTGAVWWWRLLQHDRTPTSVRPPPVWSELRLPRQLPVRLVVRGGERVDTMRVLRTVDLAGR